MNCLLNSIIEGVKAEPIKSIALYQHTTFISAKHVGLCSPPRHIHQCQKIQDVGSLHQKNSAELAKYIFSDNFLERSIGWAAINSQYNSPELIKKSSDINAFELILTHGENKNVAVMGNFPHCEKLRKNNPFKNFWVFELNPKDNTFYGPNDYQDILPQADVVLFTALTLINGTLNEFLPLVEKAYKIMTGPSSPLHPILFDYGINAICGSVVTDENKAQTYLSQGASYRQSEGLHKVTLIR